MKLKAYIRNTEAIEAGSNECGNVEKEVDIATLTTEERKILADSIGYQSEQIEGYNGGILDLDHVRKYIARRKTELAKQQAESEHREKENQATLANALASRAVKKITEHIDEDNIRVTYINEEIDAGMARGYIPSQWLELPEVVAWQAELDARNAAAKSRAETELAKRSADKKAAEKAALDARNAWISAHGSRRLKASMTEGIECEAIYRDERLALERPGWSWEREMDGAYSPPRNPSEKAFDLLDAARKTDPTAQLKYWEREADTDEDDNEVEAWRGYCAVAKFLDREIVFGLPDALRL